MSIVIAGIIFVIAGIASNALSWAGGNILILAGLCLMLVGVFLLFVREDKKKRKGITEPEPEPEPVPDPEPEPEPEPEPPMERKVIYETVFKVAGVTYKCQKDPEESRQDVLSSVQEGDLLILEEFEHKGEPAYLIVDYRTDLDIGTVPKNLAEKINAEFYGHVTQAEVDTVGSFYPDDGTEEIFFCKARLIIYD